MTYGYHGKILHVGLNDQGFSVEEPGAVFYRLYVGGSAIGLYYLLKHTPPEADPLGPQNTLTLALSVLTGAPIGGLSRVTATAKSPLTGCVGDSQAGGNFPVEMKFAGFDAFVFHGAAPEPVYLWVNDGKPELRPAGHLWGKNTADVEDILKEEIGDDRIEVLQTGIAGENGVRFAALINKTSRANGRTGMGAVMASKNLKAIVVRGKQRPEIADREVLKKLARWGADHFSDSDVHGMGLHGTAEIVGIQSDLGGLPTRNWSSGAFEDHLAIDGQTMTDTILKKRENCYACVVRCKRVVEVIDGGSTRVDPRFGGPEYETLATFGSYCGVSNLDAIAEANQICNLYGMDTISCGATIAWAMDCFEEGLLTLEDTGGLELRFGNAEAMVQLVEQIARREGFGDLLSNGSARAAGLIGRDTGERVVAVKGQELPAHMPQVKRSLALIYATNPFGADHQSSEHDDSFIAYPERMAMLGLGTPQPGNDLNEERAQFALTTQYLYSAMDTFNVCQFVFGPSWQLYDPVQLLETARAITGWDLSMDEMLEIGARRLNMMRAFNAQDLISATQDVLPEKLFQPLSGGASDGIYLDRDEVEQAKKAYYSLAFWNTENGIPTRHRLEELRLGWVADILET